MAVDAPTQQETEQRTNGFRRVATAARRAPRADDATFPELVFAHFLRQVAVYRVANGLDETGGKELEEAEAEYRHRLAAFTRRHGRIVNAYWCSFEISAVALTSRVRRNWRTLWRKEDEIRLHSATDWATRNAPRIAYQLHKVDTLAIRASEVLRETPERIALQRLLAAASNLLSFVDRKGGGPSDKQKVDEMIKLSDQELGQIQSYYESAAQQVARIVYFAGMFRSAIVLTAIGAVAVGLGDWIGWVDPRNQGVQDVLITLGMGGIGALVSVMSRMANRNRRFDVDYELGRPTLRRLGSLRPLLGMGFAFVIYLALRSQLVELGSVPKTAYFFGTVAFLAGFSERWAKVLIEGALGASSDDAQRTTAPPAPEGADATAPAAATAPPL